MKSIRTGNMKVLNMFRTFMLACRSYTDEKNTFQIDCHCHCYCQNDQEWSPDQTRMVNLSSFGSRFGTETGSWGALCTIGQLGWCNNVTSLILVMHQPVWIPRGSTEGNPEDSDSFPTSHPGGYDNAVYTQEQ